MMAHKSVYLRMVAVSLWLTAFSMSAGAQVWTQTDWSGGPGQSSWSDSTMYFTGIHEDGWRFWGDLDLAIPDDSNWANTGNLAGASEVYSLLGASDGAIYAGTADWGNVFKSTDDGVSWDSTGDLAGAGDVLSLLEASDGAIYAGTSPGANVFKSTDDGVSWANTGDLAGAGDALSLLEASDGAIYAGTYPPGEVFKSTDDGVSWANTGDLAGAGVVYSLLEASDGAVYAGTGGNGDVFRAGYFGSGELVSSVLGAGNASVTYGVMTWNETLNGQTTLMKVRTDTLPDMMTALDWVSCPGVANGQDISGLASVNDGDPYIQYRVELSTTRNDSTPVLHEVQIEYAVDLEGPILQSAVASDGTNPVPGIDDDDYVLVTFDGPTNRPAIDALNIADVLALSGGHSWLDGFGALDTTYWNPVGDMLMIRLSVDVSPPTVAVGDTITPDGVTIADEWGNPAVQPVVITGSFGGPGIEEKTWLTLPEVFALCQNQPNPVGDWTNIRYAIPTVGVSGNRHVDLAVYDLSGRVVATLVDMDQTGGVHEAYWDAAGVACGVYFYRLRVSSEGTRRISDFTDMKKMIVLR